MAGLFDSMSERKGGDLSESHRFICDQRAWPGTTTASGGPGHYKHLVLGEAYAMASLTQSNSERKAQSNVVQFER